jgi:hypothetical protein
MIEKEIYVSIGILFMLASYSIYMFSIYKGRTKPHPFSWFIWGLLTAIGFFAQISDGGGIGTIITGLSAIISFGIALIGYLKRQNIVITPSDKCAFILALSAVPLWYLTGNALWSVILITIIDCAGFYPTYRKSWQFPQQESSLSYALGGLKHIFTILALENISIITTLFPFSLVLTNFGLIIVIYLRQKIINHAK